VDKAAADVRAGAGRGQKAWRAPPDTADPGRGCVYQRVGLCVYQPGSVLLILFRLLHETKEEIVCHRARSVIHGENGVYLWRRVRMLGQVDRCCPLCR